MKNNDIKLEITSVKVSGKLRGRGAGRTRNRIYLFLDGENIMDDLLNRRSRPYNVFKAQILPALVEAGHIPSLNVCKPRWSQRCGCSCPCSPGFLTDIYDGQDIYVHYKMMAPDAAEADPQEHILAI